MPVNPNVDKYCKLCKGTGWQEIDKDNLIVCSCVVHAIKRQFDAGNAKVLCGTLNNWYRNLARTVSGHLDSDSRGRFPKGILITTSSVITKDFKEGDLIETQNSIYRLGNEALPDKLRDDFFLAGG